MPKVNAEVKEIYHWLRFKGICEVDIPKILGGNRQYYHKLRKQEGSSIYEMFNLEAKNILLG